MSKESESCDDCENGIIEEVDEFGEVARYKICMSCEGSGEVEDEASK